MSGKDTTNIGDITYQVTIPIEHVQDYNDFMNQMRKDGKFEKMIRSITVDQLSGGSKLSKNKYQWKQPERQVSYCLSFYWRKRI